MRKSLFIIFLAIIYVRSLPSMAQIEPLILHKVSNDESCRQWVDSIMSQMSLKEKVSQLFIYTIAPVQTKANLALLTDAIQTHRVGGLLFSGGIAINQAQLTNQAQKMSKVPIMITFDGEWGLSMRLSGTPVFPKNRVLGCIQDNRLIYEYGQEMARQCREIGVHVNFAPVADVNINPRNPVINVRSFGTLPDVVADKAVVYASGLESGGVLSVSKHFPGHGDTDVDSHKSMPILPFTRSRLDSIELYPFKKIINAGLGGIMVGHLHVTALDGNNDLPASLSHNVVQGLLKDELRFNGLIFTDALVMKGVSSVSSVCLQALKAGNDMVLCPPNLKVQINEVLQGIENGEISEKEITLKCRKVLTYKYALGLHNLSPVNLSGLEERINSARSRDLIRRLNEAAITGVTISSTREISRSASKSIIRKDRLDNIDIIAKEGLLKGAYPGCQIVVFKDGEAVYDKCFGTHAGGNSRKVTSTDIYDVASLSKTSATLLAVMKLYDRRLLRLSDKLSDHLPILKGTDKEYLTIDDALFHQTGLPATIPYYQKVIDENSYTGALFSKKRSTKYSIRITPSSYAQPSRLKNEYVSETFKKGYTMQIADNLWLKDSFKEVAMQEIINTPLKDKRYRYSCINFILLQQIVERLSGMTLDGFLAKEFYEPMGLKRTAFQPLRYFSKDEVIPSTTDMFLRKTVIHGYVHDEQAAFLGGVSGNAGLFSTAYEIARIHQLILNNGELDGCRYLSEETCRLFTTKTSDISHRGLGFNKPIIGDPKGNPCSNLAPVSVYGHTGFTGTCVWVDPENNLVYVFLSNRLYPNAWVNTLSTLNIRKRIQDTIYQSLLFEKDRITNVLKPALSLSLQ
ncbi:Beta-hexosaminidase [termite gut metagenome]|uniref:beta-N-acetylhexosaminidase n=1 Tax=termite gut metagenome TaxID=433724 RepID=A0A5J4SLW7_9ZZZZ